jgi:probable HAF family extracellular repeat protein
VRFSVLLRLTLGGLFLISVPAAGSDWGVSEQSLPLPWRSPWSAQGQLPTGKPGAPGYVISDVGSLGGSGSYATSLNDDGIIVGQSELTPGYFDFHAFLWTDGRMTDLGTFGGGSSSAFDVNRRGQVVGYSQIGIFSHAHACLWDDGVMTDLGHLGIDQSFAEAINDHGDIAGYSWLYVDGLPKFHACLWNDGGPIDIGTLQGPEGLSQASDINDRGQIVGRSSTADGGIHPFLWDKGVMIDVMPPGDNFGSAQGINAKGQVVGGSLSPTGHYLAFLWDDGVWTELGNLGGPDSYALAINDHGQIVGTSTTPSGESHAFLWEDGVMTDLGGGFVIDVGAINRWGQISGSVEIGFDFRATLWTPEPKGHGRDRSNAEARAALVSEERPLSGLRTISALGAIPIEFEAPGLTDAPHTAQVFDVRGRMISRWEGAAGPRGSWNGRHSDGSLAGPGIYFLRVMSGGKRFDSHVVVLR